MANKNEAAWVAWSSGNTQLAGFGVDDMRIARLAFDAGRESVLASVESECEACAKVADEVARKESLFYVGARLSSIAAARRIASEIRRRASCDGHETTKTISNWACQTFGPAGSDARIAARANEEMAELLRAVTTDSMDRQKVRMEIADVVIVLARLSDRCNGDIWQDVEAKMAINRQREWKLDGTGHGYHVRPGSEAEARATR